MLAWLKDILKEAYSEEIEGQIAGAIEKKYVSRSELAAVTKEKDEQIIALQKSEERMKKTAAVGERLRQLGATDADYIIYKQGGIDAFEFDEGGKPVGLDELADRCRADAATAFLFGAEKQPYRPALGEGAGNNPFAKETFNLTEQGKLFRKDPVGARRLAAAANAKL